MGRKRRFLVETVVQVNGWHLELETPWSCFETRHWIERTNQNRWFQGLPCEKKGAKAVPCPKYRCQNGRIQVGHDIAHSKEATEANCAKKCCAKQGCIGYDYGSLLKDCFLSATKWSQVRPTGGLFNAPIPWAKSCQATNVHDEEEEEDYPEDFAPQEDYVVSEDLKEEDENVPAEFEDEEEVQQEDEQEDEPEEETQDPKCTAGARICQLRKRLFGH